MRISVIMAGRNSKPDLLKKAINSILNQTYQDFEFIFVDDGSEKPMESVVRAISSDPRIAVYRIAHSGLGAALNYGINKSKGEYIARIDDDDIALPTRLEKQVAYLDEHPDVSCLGTQIYYKYGRMLYPHSLFPENHDDIVRRLFNLHFCMGHTVLMYRRKCFNDIGGYRISGGGQDLDLLLQMGTVGRLANLSEYLGCYTLSNTGLSVTNPKKKEAYLFALESAIRCNCYSLFHDEIMASIKALRQGAHKRNRWVDYIKRELLIWMTKLLGKDMNMVF